MKFVFLATILAALTATSTAITYRAYMVDACGLGPYFLCNDEGGVCCKVPTQYGSAVQFDQLPIYTRGIGFRDLGGPCEPLVFSLRGNGTDVCWDSNPGKPVNKLMWLDQKQSLPLILDPFREYRLPTVKSGGDVKKREGDGIVCVGPTEFHYKNFEGEPRSIKVPVAPPNASDIIASLFNEGKYAALEECEKV
ncbi:hypothetical protein CC1G_05379 [Coprinopsis cinerea okayama7|uniref:Secreted protein n=1 Tax=Coprinopsis cinerea (strain Okayama-7 / 130 / ATCC MYA-4618 / FGSC 9003) TaxID=240176 RepID=A8NPW2_COPC7|nr:hypothetical protein CC1G_05379 [Coprinopsis cinerea okayama7\|eukprot:XP_001835417.1 hypothetical protein CC1G_05379 [Coprinopsis cinerea okayama7\